MYLFYRFLSFLVMPLVPLVLWLRLRAGKEEPHRMNERRGKSSLPRPQGKLIWFHAASMGESASVMPLIKRLSELHPNLQILMTTVTVTSARYVSSRLPTHAMHQFAPVDTPLAMHCFLTHWKPDLAVWVESELWPNMVLMTHARRIPLLLLNARISQASTAMWYRFRSLMQRMLEAFSLILARSDADATRLKNLGAPEVQVKGDLKFAVPPLEADARITAEILSKVGDRPIWLASSTHPGEETVAGRVHQKLKEYFPKLLTVIVPRHSQRGPEIAQGLHAQGFSVTLRSKGEPIQATTDIYLADTMGELGIFYRIADIVFVGGSLVPHGGQNPFEPARLDCAILYGPHMDNFRDFCWELEAAEGALKVSDAGELEKKVEELLRDHERAERMAQAALRATEKNQHTLDDVFALVKPYVDALFP